jgi:hypothetical protein
MSTHLSKDSHLANPIVFRIFPIRLITRPYLYVFQNESSTSGVVSKEPIKCVWLPEREETRILIDKYINDISYIHHAIHGPSVRRLVDVVYDSVQQGHQPHMGSIALLLAIFANTTYLWTTNDLSTNLLASSSEGHSQATVWQKAAFDVVDHLQQSSHLSLEATQAIAILCFSLVDSEGLSFRYRNLFSRAITMARELGLHCVDLTWHLSGPHTVQFTALETEIRRRVWWHLCATDW